MADLEVSNFGAIVAANIDPAADLLGLIDVSAASGSKMKKVTPTVLLEAMLLGQSISLTELGYLNGVTSAIQTQLDAKQATGSYITALTGEVTAAGPGSAAATIANDAVTTAKIANDQVTYAKIQNVTDERVLGRQGGGAGDVEELSLGPGLSFGTNQIRAIPVVSPLTDDATIAVDASLSNRFRVTLGGNRTLGNPTNAVDGQTLVFEIIQDGSGNRTLALDTKFALGTDISSVTLSTAADKRDFLTVTYNSTADKFYVVAFVKGY